MATKDEDYQSLKQQIAELETRAEAKRQEELEAVIVEVREKVEQYGLTEKDIFGRRRGASKAAGSTIPPKYRNPKTGETWTGRGRAPAWIAGKNRARFEIKEEVTE